MTLQVNRYHLESLSGAERRVLMQRVRADYRSVEADVRAIVGDVRERGDAGLLAQTARLDGVTLSPAALKVTDEEFEAAEAAVSPAVRDALVSAIANIRHHHEAQLPASSWMQEVRPGVLVGERWTPITSVGLYVPRGKGSFPSVMTMLCAPAVIAAVPEVAVCTPPGPDGSVDAASLVAAALCGVRTIYKMGGAQAIAAFAYGTESVRRVEKIVGPGNEYVSTAKRLVYGEVDPGLPAGPSESVVLCDGAADPEIAARELLVEAEHGSNSAALLVTHSVALADAVEKLLPDLVDALPEQRREYCTAVLSGYGGIVLTTDLAASVRFVNEYAPEHLRVLVTNPFELLPKLDNAGEVLLGENTSIPFGNFAVGVNAILPTGGTARSQSCVGTIDFMKRSSFAYVSDEGVAEVGPTAVTLATYEGFPAHAAAAQFVVDRAAARTRAAEG
ncbi:histidinol dehydrogenase [Plantactinospora sp. CA-294935]|uniref:histidinol dehydrogenase n=1 Tax=Plantactinospora sp. CA-294935 TaxID=3240012 RepID=UPI003D8A94C6